MKKDFEKIFYTIINYYFYIFLVIPLIFCIYYTVNNFNIYNFYILLFFFLSSLLFFVIKKGFKANYFLIHFSVFACIFLTNFLIEMYKYGKINFSPPPSREEIFLKKGLKWDKKNKREYIYFLKEKLKVDNVYPNAFFPWTYYWKKNKHFMNVKVNKKLFSLTNVSKSTIVLCKESGVWNYYNSDKYGFHNPKNVITNDKLGYVILLGDSFTASTCVKNGEGIGYQLRKLNYNIINLGKAPGGTIHANAIYREYKNYIKKENPVVVIYLMYGENDLADNAKENNIPVLRNYFINSDYSNNLINKQYEIDEMWKSFFKIVYDEDFYIKNINNKKLKFHIYKVTEDELSKKEKSLSQREAIKMMFLRLLKIDHIRSYIIRLLEQNTDRKKDLMLLKKLLDKLNKEVNKTSKFIVVYLPSFYELTQNKRAINKNVINILDDLNIENINIFEYFRKVDFLNFFDAEIAGHYNSNGYNYLAEVLDEHLKMYVSKKK